MRIRLLGGFAVEIDGRDVAARPWRLRKSRTLIKVLALAPEQRMHRDRLLHLLWPDRARRRRRTTCTRLYTWRVAS